MTGLCGARPRAFTPPAKLPTAPALLLLLTAVACGGPALVSEAPEPSPVAETAGSEAPPSDDAGTSEILMTTPVPVPQPAVPRQELSEALQAYWTRVEESVAETMPPAPEGTASEEAIGEWSEADFAPWLEARLEQAAEVRAMATELPEVPYERVVGAALFGYLFEDLASSPRGAPVPETIATDAELLGVYIDTLNDVFRGVARTAFDAYVYCAEHAATTLAETGWDEWALYCYQRAGDVNDTFRLTEDEAAGGPDPS